jgi:hypothetical protein
MTHQEAAQSMREAARRLDAWSRAMEHLTAEELGCLRKTFAREAERLRSDAEKLETPDGPQATTAATMHA